MWIEKFKQLGTVKVGAKRTIIFTYKGDDMVVSKLPDQSYFLVPSCGCATPKWNPNTKELTINFVAKDIPEHLKLAGKKEFYSIKTISVHNRKGENLNEVQDILSFGVTIKQ